MLAVRAIVPIPFKVQNEVRNSDGRNDMGKYSSGNNTEVNLQIVKKKKNEKKEKFFHVVEP